VDYLLLLGNASSKNPKSAIMRMYIMIIVMLIIRYIYEKGFSLYIGVIVEPSNVYPITTADLMKAIASVREKAMINDIEIHVKDILL